MARLIFTYTSCKYDSFTTTENYHIASNKLSNFIFKHLMRKYCSWITLCCCCTNISVITWNSRNTKHTRLFIEKVTHLRWCKTFLFSNKCNNRRVECTCTSTHHKAIERCKSHTCIYNLATINSCYRWAITKMTAYNLCILNILAKKLCTLSADISVWSSVETIAANTILFIIFVRNRIHISLRWHCWMKGCVEYSNLWQIFAKNISASNNTLNMSFIMERCKRNERFYSLDDIIIYKDRFSIKWAALNNSMTNSGNIRNILNNSVFRVKHSLYNTVKSVCVVIHRKWLVLNLKTSMWLKSKDATIWTNSLTNTLCENLFVLHIYKLEL